VFGLTNGISYTFKVYPVTSNGYTNAGEVVARPQTTAQAPREFMAVWGNRQVSLKWIAPAVTGANADQLFGYRLEQSTDGATWGVIATVNPSVLAYVVTGLTNGVNYSFRISLLTTVGQGASSITSSTPFGTPSAVRNLTGIAGDRKVDLTWDAPADLGGGTIVGYRVFTYCAGGTDSGVATGCGPYTVNTYTLIAANISPLQRSLTVNGLINGTNYLFLVQPLTGVNTALNSWITCEGYFRDGASAPLVGDTTRCSQYSRVLWITPMGSPSSPKGLNVVMAPSASSTKASVTATLSWTAPDWSGGDYINGYRIEQSTDGTNWTTLTSNTGYRSMVTYTVSGLEPGTRYWFRVSAIGSLGTAGTSSVVTAGSLVASDAPQGLVISRVNDTNTALLTWSAPSFTGGSAIIGYRVERLLSGAWFTVTPNTGNTNTSFTIDGYDAATALNVRVSAVTSAGAGDTALAILEVGGVLNGGLRFTTSIGNGFADLAWSGTSAYTPTSYRMEYRIVGNTSWTLVTADMGATTSYRLGGLTNGVNYEVRVTPIYTVGGVSSFGTSSNTFFVPTAAASAPANLSATTAFNTSECV
jgi:titin